MSQPAARPSKVKPFAKRFALSLLLMAAAAPSNANILSWSGGGYPDANWSNSANWGFVASPQNGDTLIFSSGQPNLLNTNNIANLVVNQMRFIGSGGYDIRGNTIIITNNIQATNTAGSDTIEAGLTLTNTNVVINVSTLLTLSGAINGNGGLLKMGSGTLQLYGSAGNSYTGGTMVQGGTCQLGKSSGVAIPVGALTIGDNLGSTGLVQNAFYGGNISSSTTVRVNASSTLDLDGLYETLGPITLDGGNIQTETAYLTMNGDMICTNSTGVNYFSTVSGHLSLGVAMRTFTVFGNDGLLIDANVSGSGGIIKAGVGSMYLNASNSYSGLTVVQTAVLWAQNSWALGTTDSGTVVSNGATLSIAGGIGITNETLTLNGPGLGGWASLDNENAETDIWNGPVILAASSSIGCYNSAGEIRVLGPISGPGGLSLFYATGAVSFEGTTTNTYSGLTTVPSGATLLLSKSVTDGAIAGNLDVLGTLRLKGTSQISDKADVNLEASGLFDFGIYWDRIDTLHGSGSVTFGTNGWIEVGGNNGGSIFYGTMSGVGYTLGGYTVGKFGTGTFIMNGNCSFTSGVIEIFAGALLANGTEPQISVINYSTTTFGGAGSIGGLTADGYVDPGNGSGTPNILTCTNVTIANSGGLIVDLNGPVPGGANGYDQLFVNNGTVSLNGLLTVYPSFTVPVGVGQTFTIVNNTANHPISGTFVGLPQGAGLNVNNYGFTITYSNAGFNNVVLTLTNVPGAAAGYAVSAGNGSGGIDPNSCNYISLSISNKTGTPMTGVSATLLSETPNVFVTQPFSAYSDAPANGTATNTTMFQMSTTSNFVCGNSINLNLAVTTANAGSFIVPFTLASGSASPTPSRYDVSVITNIPDIGTIESTNTVSGFVGPVAKVAVSLWLTHPVDSDLTISLVGPNGVVVPLVSGTGSGANFGSACSPDADRTTFDDSAAISITAGSPPFMGTYRPQSPLSALANISGNGNWRLRITDSVGGSLGALRCWSLFLSPTICPSGGGLCELCPNVTITGATGPGSPTETNYIYYVSAQSVCGVPKACPGTITNGPFPADTYMFRNGPSNSCITVTVENDSPLGSIITAAYSEGFDRHNPDSCANYLADPGIYTSAANPTATFSFSVTSNQVFYINLLTDIESPSLPYRLTVTGGDCRPELNITPTGGNQVQLDWTTAAANFALEATNHLVVGAKNWPVVTNVPIVVNSKYVVTNSAPIGSQFYRLHNP